jgi:hypothetical protein
MAGTFAHISIVDSLCDVDILNDITTLTPAMKGALKTNLNFCELGSVSPDYPYLTFWDGNAQGWANVMHYWKTADFVRNGIPLVSRQGLGTLDKPRCIAWLFGYVAHLVTDLTVHPIVNERVGPYEQNKIQHRICEINQDVYIFKQLNHEDITAAEYISDKNCGVASCGAVSNRDKLQPVVSRIWSSILEIIFLQDVAMKASAGKPNNAPDPDEWHEHFVALVDEASEKNGFLFPLARYVAETKGIAYPEYEHLDRSFIYNLKSPLGGTLGYDQVFRMAQDNVKKYWGELGAALVSKNPKDFTLPNADLDTGLDEGGQSVFWRLS